MPFQKGQSGNPQGRAKGSKNKRTAYIRRRQEAAVLRALKKGTSPLDVLMTIMMGGPKADRIDDRQQKAAEKLLGHFHPPLAPVAPTEQKATILILGGLPDESDDKDTTANAAPGSGQSVPDEEQGRNASEEESDPVREEMGKNGTGGDDSR